MPPLFDITGKIALVTGGAQGLGRMIAEGLVNAGCKVYITSRKQDIGDQAAREMSERGQCIALVADLSTPEACTALAHEIKRSEQRLDVLVNNAGRTWGAPLESFPDKAWAAVMAVNVQGPFTLVRELLSLLKAAGSAQDPARVINVGSVAGAAVEPISAYSYAASKAAIHHLSKVLAAELAPDHITVNVIVPGYFPTQMTAHIRRDDKEAQKLISRVPLARLGRPDAIFLDGGAVGCR
jgi:NAD(P)-dependent dehydrogenase (short-subunit alcohol dehydrogenase family)